MLFCCKLEKKLILTYSSHHLIGFLPLIRYFGNNLKLKKNYRGGLRTAKMTNLKISRFLKLKLIIAMCNRGLMKFTKLEQESPFSLYNWWTLKKLCFNKIGKYVWIFNSIPNSIYIITIWIIHLTINVWIIYEPICVRFFIAFS
jgi:hypothetical protein